MTWRALLLPRVPDAIPASSRRPSVASLALLAACLLSYPLLAWRDSAALSRRAASECKYAYCCLLKEHGGNKRGVSINIHNLAAC